MTLRENLLKKIKIGKLANQVLNSLKTKKDAIRKIDRKAMKTLLSMAPYSYRKERDLELYIHEAGSGDAGEILVLDNDLPIYRTSVDDVALRKSPTVKEMISIRNAIRILNDKDVVISRTSESVLKIKGQCLDLLDLQFSRADIEELAGDGKRALAADEPKDVCDIISLFSELLDFKKAPASLKVKEFMISGIHSKSEDGRKLFGPCVIYSLITNDIKFSGEQADTGDKKEVEAFRKMAATGLFSGTRGDAVFDLLLERVMGQGV